MLLLERAEVVRRLESRGLVEIADSRDVGDVELTRLVNLLTRLATMEAAVRAADRLLDASETTPTGERRYVGSITEDWEAFWEATELLETEDSDDA